MENKRYESNSCGPLVVARYVSAREVYVVFEGYEDEIKTTSYQVRSGQVKNPMMPTLYGVGFIGIGRHKTKYDGKHTSCYRAWNHMIERCYSSKFHSTSRYKGKGVSVCDQWHNFQNFSEWYYLNYKDGFELDKDILVQGCDSYSPQTCLFIPQEVNKLFTGRYNCRGGLPIGVTTRRNCHSFVASCQNGTGRNKYLGSYKTPEEAFNAYMLYKRRIIDDLAERLYNSGDIDNKVRDAMLNYQIDPYPE